MPYSKLSTAEDLRNRVAAKAREKELLKREEIVRDLEENFQRLLDMGVLGGWMKYTLSTTGVPPEELEAVLIEKGFTVTRKGKEFTLRID